MNKILAVVLAVVLFFLLGSYDIKTYPELASEVAHPFAATINSHEGYARSQLDDAGQQLYDILKDGLLEELTEIHIRRTNYTEEDIVKIVGCIKQDAPEIFWVNWSSWEYVQHNEGLTIRPLYLVTGEAKIERARLLEEACAAVINQVTEAGITDGYDKVRFVHNYLIETVNYQEEGPADVHSAYGALVDKIAVCDGYAHAFQLLLTKMGIECYYIEGYTKSSPPGVGHAWNMVHIDGKYHLVDTTWDDVDMTSEERWVGTALTSYRYFLLSTEELALTHISTSPVEMPQAERYGAYAVAGLSSPTLEPIVNNIIDAAVRNAGEGRYYVEFEFLDTDAINYLKDNQDKEVADIINGVNDALKETDLDLQYKNVIVRNEPTVDGYIIRFLFNPRD